MQFLDNISDLGQNQQEFDQRFSRFSEGEALSMKPSSGLAKDGTVSIFSTF